MWVLKKWRLELWAGVLARGMVYGDPDRKDGSFIYTNRIEYISYEGKKQFEIRTHIGDRYILALDEMDPEYLEQTIELLKRRGVLGEEFGDDIAAICTRYEKRAQEGEV